MDELTEARGIIGDLAAIASELKPIDWRFVQSWRQALDRRGPQIRIGVYRLASLRECHQEYFGAKIEQAA